MDANELAGWCLREIPRDVRAHNGRGFGSGESSGWGDNLGCGSGSNYGGSVPGRCSDSGYGGYCSDFNYGCGSGSGAGSGAGYGDDCCAGGSGAGFCSGYGDIDYSGGERV
jgi:hypothetical protein